MRFLKYGFIAAAISTAILTLNQLGDTYDECTDIMWNIDFSGECFVSIASLLGSAAITLLFLGGAFWKPKNNN